MGTNVQTICFLGRVVRCSIYCAFLHTLIVRAALLAWVQTYKPFVFLVEWSEAQSAVLSCIHSSYVQHCLHGYKRTNHLFSWQSGQMLNLLCFPAYTHRTCSTACMGTNVQTICFLGRVVRCSICCAFLHILIVRAALLA
jgi:hypothetical protein